MRAVHAGPKPNADHRDEAGRGFESDQVNFGGRIEGYSRLVLRTKYIVSNTAAKSILSIGASTKLLLQNSKNAKGYKHSRDFL